MSALNLDVVNHTIQVNGVKLNVVEKGEGSAVVFLHGFPDSWSLWRNQIDALSKAGYRTIAIDQRGFGNSDKPKDVKAYEMPLLVEDVKGVMDELHIENAHIVAHDWGACVGWALAAKYPERVNRFIPIASGYPIYNRTIDGLEKSWYVYMIQFSMAEDLFSKDNYSLLRQWGRNHSETPKWVKEMSRPGALTGAFNWYRANYSPANNFVIPFEYKEIEAPTMGIFGVNDPFLEEIRMLSSSRYVKGTWRYERVYNAGHWVQLDQSDYVNDLILEFISTNL